MESMRFKVGDRVKIKSLDWYNENKDEAGNIRYKHGTAYPIFFSKYMSNFCGEILTIKSVFNHSYHMNETSSCEFWTDDMIEGLAEEETKPNVIEEAKTYWDSIKDAWICPEGYIFKDENGNVINATKIVLEKKKKEYDKGTKVRHKTKGMVETIVGLCKVKVNGAWVDGVIYEGNDVHTGEPMTFVRVKEDFENNFEVL